MSDSDDDAVFCKVDATLIEVKGIDSYYDDMWLESAIFGKEQYRDWRDRINYLKCYFMLGLKCPLKVTATLMEIQWEQKTQVPMLLRRDLSLLN